MIGRNASTLLSQHARIWTLILLVAVCIPHFFTIPLWLGLVVLMLLGWGITDYIKPLPIIARYLKLSIVFMISVSIFLSSAQVGGLTGLIMLLIAAITLKILELRTLRDAWVVLLAAFFMIAVSLIIQQSMFAALYAVFCLFLAVIVMLTMHEGQQIKPMMQVNGSLALQLLLQSVPLMLILFIVFPRIQPLWTMNFASGATTGLSDSISPGEVSRLTRSDEPVFRVSFQGDTPPPQAQRYWRAMTFSRFDGRSWSLDKTIKPVAGFSGESLYQYQVITEPSVSPWLFALEDPVGNVPSHLKGFNDSTLKKVDEKNDQRISYSMHATTPRAERVEILANRDEYMSIPSTGNEKTRQLVNQWLQEGLQGQEIIDKLFQFYAKSFQYTLTPQLLKGDPIDSFLFETRAGFCEHFASSSAYLLRLAGIPSRVVGGYLGGEWNPYENYLLVRQYEAHAWVEAWLPERGWFRLDPTAVVAPERLTDGAGQLFQNSEYFLSDQRFSLFRISSQLPFLAQLRQQYDALNYKWHKNVLGYQNEQMALLESLFGKVTWLKMLVIVFAVPSVLMGWVLWRLLKPTPLVLHPLDSDLKRLSKSLIKVDDSLERLPSETVMAYIARIEKKYPELTKVLTPWSRLYDRYRFAEVGREIDLPSEYHDAYKQLAQAIRNLKG